MLFRSFVALLIMGASASAAVHGIANVVVPGTPKTVLNMNYGSDQYLNLAKNFAPALSGSVTPANLNSNSFPSGVLPAGYFVANTLLPSGYYGHYTIISTGISGMEWNAQSTIIYSGGQQVFPSFAPGFGTSPGNTTFLNNGPWNVEFAFGDTIATVQNSPNTPGLVQLISTNSTGFQPFYTGTTVQIHNVANLSSSTVWTVTNISNSTIDLQGSAWNASMVPATGNPGTIAEAIYNPVSITPAYMSSIPVFGTVTHSITSLILCKTSDLAAIQAGDNISTAAITSLTTLKPKWLRFMDMQGVQATSGQFAYLPTTSASTFNSAQWLTAYYGGATAGSGDAYTVNGGPSSPVSGPYLDGEVIQFQANRSSVGQLPTLAINGRSTGAKPVLSSQGQEAQFIVAGQSAGIAVTSIVGNGTTATVTTTANHGFTVGQKFLTNIGGNTPSGFNTSNALATSTGVNTFTYSNATNATTSVAGTFTPLLADGDILNLTFTASNMPSGAYTFSYYVNLALPSYTATTSGKIMTVTAIGSGRITPGQQITGAGLSNAPIIAPYGSAGTTGTGGTGTYALTIAPVGTTTITGATFRTGAGCSTGLVNSVSTLSADLSCTIFDDQILTARGYQFANSGSGISIAYPAAVSQMTPSSSITATGGVAETVTPSWGTLTSGTLYTAQYRALAGGWIVNAGSLQVGIPLSMMKEYATKSGAGIWFNIQLAYSQASAQALGAYLANNFGSTPIALEIGNELWNIGQGPNHFSQNLGIMEGFAAAGDGLYFHSTYAYLGWAIENISQTVVDAYVAAGGNRNNINILMEMSGSDGSGEVAGGSGGQTNAVQIAFTGSLLKPTPASFTGTITPNTNGLGAVLTVSGISGSIYPGFQLNGAGVTGGTRISGCLPAQSYCTGNGTYQLDTVYGGSVGPVAMTATNVTYSAIGGPGATATSADYSASPNRPIDKADAVGYATYWGGAIVPEGAGGWTGAQSTFNPFFLAAQNYVTGIATSNNALVQSGLNVWSADANGQAVANRIGVNGFAYGNNECGFLSSNTTFGFCNNAPDAVITGTTGGTTTLTVTNVASGTITPGMAIRIGGSNSVPLILPYGTSGTTGVGGTGTYALSVAFTPGTPISNTTIGVGIGTVQGWENLIAAFDGTRPNGKANLSVLQYEGSLQEAFCSGGCPVGNINLAIDSVTLANQFTANGWNLDPTYGYPGFGAGNTQTAQNVISLFLGYVNSQQYYNDALFFYQKEALIHAARPNFSPAQYGIEGTPGATATTGAPQWGMYPGDLSTSPLQNYVAQTYFNTH
jgi:hypothetical protein